MTMSTAMYDNLKWVARYILPALGTLYFVLSGIWGLPYGEKVVGTIAALDTFLNVVLGISNAKYVASLKTPEVAKSDPNQPPLFPK